MAQDYAKVLLVSANVGSIFEDPENTLNIWLKEFLSNVKRLNPDFLAIHCQEVGGKNYEQSMQHVNQFVKRLLASEEMRKFNKARIFLDEDFTAVDKFTALGNLYFIHENIENVEIYDFEECKYVSLQGQEVLSGNIESVSIKEKAKFPQEFFPDFKWSRKGFMRTRWLINNSEFDLINIHLFHDASNIIAMEQSPSIYRGFRRRAFEYTLERFKLDKHGQVPYFIFGDFNFRLDLHSLSKKLTQSTILQRVKNSKNDTSKIEFSSNEDGRPILTIEKKGFDHHNEHNAVFSNNNNKWLHEYDQEALLFKDHLFEYDITFPPSYPFSEDYRDGTSYMRTRCPSWCDRILLTHTAKDLIHPNADISSIDYGMMGPNVCMGDHKPIYLNLKLKSGASSHNTDGASAGICSHSSSVNVSDGTLESTVSEPSVNQDPADQSGCQIRITEVDSTKYIHVRQNGVPVRVFRETSV